MPAFVSMIDYCIKQVAELTAQEWSNWQGLVQTESACRWPFLSPAYIRAADAIFGHGRVVVLYQAGQAVGFLPLQKRHGRAAWFGIYEPVAGPMTDYFGLIAKPETRVQIGSLLKAAGIGAVEFSHLDEDQPAQGLVASESRTGLRTELNAGPEAYWDACQTRDRKKFADLRRCERRLRAEYQDVQFEFQSSRPEQDFADLVRLKQEQYLRTEQKNAPLYKRDNIAFLKRLLTERDAACTGILSVLRVDGRAIAMHMGLLCYERLHYWFPVYEPEFNAYSPGRVLFSHLVNAGWEQGVRCIDHGEGDTPAKREFATDEHQLYRGVWAAPGSKGLWARAGVSLGWRLGW